MTIDADPDPSDTWIFDIERGSWRRFTLSAHNLDPHWTPDGSSLSFCSDRGRGVEPFLQPLADGAAAPLLPDEAVTQLIQCLDSWSPDASSFLFHEIHPERPDPRGDRTHVEVILNWFQELKQRVPVP